jgi:hypothetical protein
LFGLRRSRREIDGLDHVPYTFHPPWLAAVDQGREMDVTSPEMAEIMAAGAIHQSDKPRGRALLLELWEKLSPDGKPLEICSMAHILADGETDVGLELEWDLRALEAATGSREPEDLDTVPPVPTSFLPSMHLSVGECYRRLGDLERARRHVLCAANRIGTLSDDAYGDLIRGGLRRLQGLLAVP